MTDDSGDQLVRLATPADHPAMVRVLMSAFGAWPSFPLRGSALEHLEWKLASTELHAVLVIDGELAGVSSSWHSDVRVGSELVPVYNGADFAILPELQGRGLGRLLDDIWESGDSSNYLTIDAVAQSAAVRHMYPVTGPTVRIQVWSRAAGLRQRLGAVARRLLGARRAPVPAPAVEAPRDSHGLVVEPIVEFGADADELGERSAEAFDVLWRRDADWLNWRYLDPRAGVISVWGVRSEGALLGYLAMRHPDDQGVARVLDLLTVPGRTDVSLALLEHATTTARGEGATHLEAWLAPGHPDTGSFQRAGFGTAGSGRRVHFDVRKLRETPEVAGLLSQPETRFHIALGDFDWA